MDQKPHIFIAIPSYGGWMRNQTTASLMRLSGFLVSAKIKIRAQIIDLEDISHVRNFCGSFMLQHSEYTHILFVDNDMEFQPTTVQKFIQARKPLIAAVCSRKTTPPVSNVYGGYSNALQKPLDTVPGIGLALSLIETKVFRAMADTGKIAKYNNHFKKGELDQPLYGFFDRAIDSNGLRISEDFSFCTRYRELCGDQVWALSGENIGHVGDMTYRL